MGKGWKIALEIGVCGVVVVAYVLLWALTMAGRWNITQAANVGEAFNAVTGFLTLAALGAAIWSIRIQSRELDEQQEQLAVQARQMREMVIATWRGEVREPYAELLGALGDLYDTVVKLIPMQGRPRGTPSTDESALLTLGEQLVVKQSRGLRLVELTDLDPTRRQLAAQASHLCERSYILISSYIGSGQAVTRDNVQLILEEVEAARTAANTMSERLSADLAAPEPSAERSAPAASK